MKTITKLSLVVLMLFSTTMLFSQALITDEETPTAIDGKAMLEIRSTNATAPKGLLIPKVDFSLEAGIVILPNMETNIPDGLIVYNQGTSVDKGLWYYDFDGSTQTGKWVIFSNANSTFALDPDNYGELFEYTTIGTSTPYSINNSYWTPWATALPPEQLGANFSYALTAAMGGNAGGLDASKLVVEPDGGGIYQVNVTATVEALSSGIQLIGALFVDGVIQEKVNFRFNFQTSNDVAALSAGGIITLLGNQQVDFRFQSESALESIGIINLNMTLTKIGQL